MQIKFFKIIFPETSTWTIPDIKGKSPIARTNHTLVYLNNKLYLFGGNDTTRGQNSESNHYGTYGDFQMFDLGITIQKPCKLN